MYVYRHLFNSDEHFKEPYNFSDCWNTLHGGLIILSRILRVYTPVTGLWLSCIQQKVTLIEVQTRQQRNTVTKSDNFYVNYGISILSNGSFSLCLLGFSGHFGVVYPAKMVKIRECLLIYIVLEAYAMDLLSEAAVDWVISPNILRLLVWPEHYFGVV